MVDPLIAKAVQLKIATPEEKAVGRIFGEDELRDILVWAKSQSAELGLVTAVRRLVELGLKTKGK
ncbi:hypothetical protein SAMN05443247_03919 [Bradyrhizobium erythrophlei]|jgi:hypothetical protein|nr:hypothetical protein SAMN05443247_03919 [Bradyrhizobium erythrophlei]